MHIPFCDTVCYYCGCNKVITKDRGKSAEYAGYIAREADLVLEHLTGNRTIEQLHFGGGTPTFLSNAELEQVMAMLAERFPLAGHAECSIEVDPNCVVTTSSVACSSRSCEENTLHSSASV